MNTDKHRSFIEPDNAFSSLIWFIEFICVYLCTPQGGIEMNLSVAMCLNELKPSAQTLGQPVGDEIGTHLPVVFLAMVAAAVERGQYF